MPSIAVPPPAPDAKGVLAADHHEAAAEILDVADDGLLLGARDPASRDVGEDDEVVGAQGFRVARELARGDALDVEVIGVERPRQRAGRVATHEQDTRAPAHLAHHGRRIVELGAVEILGEVLCVEACLEHHRSGLGDPRGHLDLLSALSQLDALTRGQGIGGAVAVEAQGDLPGRGRDQVDGDLEGLAHPQLVR